MSGVNLTLSEDRPMKKIEFAILVLSVLFLPHSESFNINAQETDIYDMSVDDILNMEVTTASKNTEIISDAPAVVTVINSDRINELGVQSLRELMGYVPGFSVSDTYWKPGIITSRGVKMTLYNDKILMLINGVPAYDAMMEYYIDAVPISAVKCLEIIRGPGSTLYGTNAFSAVINVITRSPGNGPDPAVSVKLGSYGTREVEGSFGGSGSDLEYFFAASLRDDNGYVRKATDEYGVTGEIQYENDNHVFFTGISYGSLMLNAGCVFRNFGRFGPVPAFFAGNDLHRKGGRGFNEKYYLNAVYARQLSEKLKIRGTVHYNFMDKQADIGSYGERVGYRMLGIIDSTTAPDYYRFGGQVLEGELQFNYIHSRYFNLVGGVMAERRRISNLADLYDDLGGEKMYEGSTSRLPIDTDDFGGYLQLDVDRGRFGYVAGLRYSYLGISEDGYITPRAGIIFRANRNTSLKILYGEAFRGAGPQEQYYKVAGIIYGAEKVGIKLKPERIRTYELGIDQRIGKKHNLRLNGFFTEVSDLIGRRPGTPDETDEVGSARVYDNLGDQTLYGAELEFSGYPLERFNYFANISCKEGTEGDSGEDIEFIERITANAGFSWRVRNWLNLSPNAQYLGGREGFDLEGDRISVDGYFLLHLTLMSRVAEDLGLTLNFRNILDEKYAYPEHIRRREVSTDYGGPMTIPGGPGRSLYFEASYGF